MGTMLLTTIQDAAVHRIINDKGIVWPNKQSLKNEKKHIKKAYKRIAKYARKVTKKKYKVYPFWCTYTDLGINTVDEGQLKLTLEVPEEYILLSNYDKWVEYLDYSESQLSTQFWKRFSKLLFDTSSCERIQANVPCIKKEWITKTEYA